MQAPFEEGDTGGYEEIRERQEVDWNMERKGFHMERVFRIAKKYHTRSFMTNFKSTVLQKLLQDNTRHRQKHQQLQVQQKQKQIVDDWPYRSLLMKPNKTEHEQLEIQFVSMCAEKIQAVFKGYLARKRFSIAYGRLKKFAQKTKALIKGWKVRNVMRCLKVQEEVKSIKIKRNEVEKQMKSNSQNSKFNQRRLEYLKSSLQAEMSHFHKHFSELYEEGAWVYEPRSPYPCFKKMQKWSERKQIVQPMKENTFNQAELQLGEFQPQKVEKSLQEPPKKKRVREMRDNAKRGRNKQQGQKQEETVRIAQKQAKIEVAYSQASTNLVEDRPIQAKGAYTYTQEQNISKPHQSFEPIENNDEVNEENDNKKTQLKKIEKKKHQKRQKYDPRKAIEEQKKRKKQQIITDNKMKEQIHSETEILMKSKPSDVQKDKDKEVVQSKSQKIIKLQKEDNNRSTVNFPKNKPKVQPKIDCWGNRKTVIKKNTQQYIIKANKIASNPSIQIQEEQQYNQVELIPSARLAAKINERRGKGKERLQYSQQREKARIQIERNCEQSERIKQEFQRHKQQEVKQTQAVKLLKAQALRQRQRVAQEQRQKRKDLVYRSVQQLTQTYKNQYLTRFQNLFPKLSLLAAARTSQQDNLIPVLTLDSDFVERMMEQNKLNQRFWYTVSKMERRFKDFVKG